MSVLTGAERKYRSFLNRNMLLCGWLHKPDLPAHQEKHETTKESHRITESQNGRGWKGPLWVM